MQGTIINFTNFLQRQTVIPCWSIADEEVVRAASQNRKPLWSKKSKKIRFLVSVAVKLKLVDNLLFSVGVLKAFLIYKKIKSNDILTDKKFKKVFFGFGASSEEHLYNEFKSFTAEPQLYINFSNYVGLNQLPCPSLYEVFLELRKHAFGYSKKFEKAPREITNFKIDFLTVCAKNVGTYIFFSVYWRLAKKNGVDEVIFLAPDIPAFACVDENIKTIFTQHGLIGLGILMPNFNRINAITDIEARYFKKILPNTEVVKVAHKIIVSPKKNNTVIILSPNIHPGEDIQRIHIIEPFIFWARTYNMKIIIRPTHRVSKDELLFLKDRFSDCIIDDITVSIYKSLETWQPKFITAWRSTSLAIALEAGYLPISLSPPDDVDWNMLFPLKERVLFWLRDKDHLKKAVESDDAYQKYMINLNSL